VLAYASTAVPATMDGGGVLYDHKDPYRVAALMHALVANHDLTDRIVDAQDAALARLQARDFDGTLLRFVRETLAKPRRPMPEVAFDFWKQFAMAESLEEIRQTRPAAFQALPLEDAATPVAELGHRA
jgi:hypothetical protein